MLIPLFLVRLRAGFPSPAADHIDQTLDLNELIVRHPASTFFVYVEGESMEGAGIYDGDLLVVDRALEARMGDVVVAVLDGEFTVKRLHRRGRRVFLHADHADYAPIEVTEGHELAVWGVVLGAFHFLR